MESTKSLLPNSLRVDPILLRKTIVDLDVAPAAEPPPEYLQPFPLTSAQRGIWFAQHLMPDTPIVIANYAEIRGPVDVDLLDRVVRATMHELDSAMLRLVEIDGNPCQVVDHTLNNVFERIDLRGVDDPAGDAAEWMRASYTAPIDLVKDRLIKGAVIQLADNHFYWYSCVHHIVLDGFAAMAFINRGAELYTQALSGDLTPPHALPPLTVLNDSEDDYRRSDRYLKDRDYWMTKAAGLPEPASLALNTASPDAQPRRHGHDLEPDLAAAVSERIALLGTLETPFLIAALAAYMSRLTGADDLVLSLPVSGRTNHQLRRSGGMVSNVVPIRTTITENTTLSALVRSIALELTGALRHQRYRSEDLRRDLGGTDDARGFYGPAINIMNFPANVALGPLSGEFHILSTGPVNDLSINLYPSMNGNTRIDFEANRRTYSDTALAAHHARFLAFLHACTTCDPESPVLSLDVLTDHEYSMLVPHVGPPAATPSTLTGIIRRAVESNPDGVAVISEATQYTYREMDEWTDRFAHLLSQRGVGTETVVAVALSRSIASIRSIWATTKAGAVFVPGTRTIPPTVSLTCSRTPAPAWASPVCRSDHTCPTRSSGSSSMRSSSPTQHRLVSTCSRPRHQRTLRT